MEIHITKAGEQSQLGLFFKCLDHLVTLHQRKFKLVFHALKIAFFMLSVCNMKGVSSVSFDKEDAFERSLIAELSQYGWSKDVIEYPTEQDLIANWARILYENNKSIDRLGDWPLTNGEMGQIMAQIGVLSTPARLNEFINGRTVTVVRDNPADVAHLGKEVTLKIYDRDEIARGQSRYQIARQPQFSARSKMYPERRGDLMLLINGMPVFHIELKRTGVPVSQAYRQIEKYAHEGVFTGLFSLVQIFVAMTPEEAVYFANPGPEGRFNTDYYFHWADFDNQRLDEWHGVVKEFLSIPMAHQMIGFYTVADASDGVLKVLRSYQYYAARAISDRVAKMNTGLDDPSQLGGYVWHTTGSGKTMTSFKAAQLIANSRNADKVVFLMDRVELGTQSLREYRNFAGDGVEVQATENTGALAAKLKSGRPQDTLIVTSIQKMSLIREEDEGGLKAADLEAMRKKRIVFIVDECHRSTFGDMMSDIKQCFPRAVFFGFTGTPIQEENQKGQNTTATIFGNELHRYSIADGIKDHNVLGFDPYMVPTYSDLSLRRAVALEQCHAQTESEALNDPDRASIYQDFMTKVPMAGRRLPDGAWEKGIEDYLPKSQYSGNDGHHSTVVQNILGWWNIFSRGGMFHAILATESIAEAIAYYRLFKERGALRVSALFDPSIDNNEGAIAKEDALAEIISDYNAMFGQSFTIPTWDRMKKDMSARLAHKAPYARIENDPEKQLDLLIVVDQMLTGFDSKWVNSLYLDKVLKYENIIQAFSRTNRLFGPEKPHGTIRWYRKPHTMKANVDAAIKLYSGDKPFGLFVSRLKENIEAMNDCFHQIDSVFRHASVSNFERLPEDEASRRKFAKLFGEFNDFLQAAKVQGFSWKVNEYSVPSEDEGTKVKVTVEIDERAYMILLKRYQELFSGGGGGTGSGGTDAPYPVKPYLTEISTGKIDADYMNSRFEKYLKLKESGADAAELAAAAEALHASFAALSQEEQELAALFLRDIQRGQAWPEPGKTFRDLLTERAMKKKDNQIMTAAIAIGVDPGKLKELTEARLNEENINQFGRFDALKSTLDVQRAKAWFEAHGEGKLPVPKVKIKADKLLRDFILKGGYELEAQGSPAQKE